ncbi:MAG TPA: protoporphyrinogen oxidase HemJ [Gammaproteobacteria bacterium]|nr:protoporphyrinogen oxidase HemJ [Gammaproteobacteria bacterium]
MLWIKAFHVIFMVTWFAGLFYLPRLFVYHAEAADDASRRRFAVMEKRLFVLMSIGMTATIGFGVWLLVGWWLPPPAWLEAKIGLVVLLIVYHHYCIKLMRDLAAGRNVKSSRFYRLFNEIPTLFLFAIVILAFVKPF